MERDKQHLHFEVRIDKMIVSKEEFNEKVSEIKNDDTGWIDAVNEAIKFFDLDVESVSELISDKLRAELLLESKNLRMIKNDDNLLTDDLL